MLQSNIPIDQILKQYPGWSYEPNKGFYKGKDQAGAGPFTDTQYSAPPGRFDPLTGNLSYYGPAMSNVSNALGLAEGQLDAYAPQSGAQGARMYTRPPAQGRLMDTLGALQGMSGRENMDTPTFGGARAQALSEPMIAGLGASEFLSMVLQEPGRVNQLLQSLLGGYQLSGGILGEQAASQAQARQIRQGRKSQRAAIFNTVPLVGGLIAASQ